MDIVFETIWDILNANIMQTFVTALALMAAYWLGKRQNEINSAIHRTQDAVELYATFSLRETKDGHEKPISGLPLILVQNVGTRLIYLDQYIFNGKTFQTNGQVLPSTYSQASNNFYWIELPTNGETHVSVEVYYHDPEKRKWRSEIYADLVNGYWKIETLPRKPLES